MPWYSLFRMPVLLAALSLAGICTPASAFVPPTINIAPPFAMGKMQRDLLDRRNNTSRTQDQLATPDTVIDTSRFNFSFKPDRTRTQRNLRNFVERTSDPAARADMERLIELKPNIMDEVVAYFTAVGIDPYDVADAYAIWAIYIFLVVEQKDDEPDQGTINAVRQQVRAAFAATPDFAATDNAQRQEYAEALLLQSVIMVDAFHAVQGSPDVLNQLSANARTMLRSNGIDPALIVLTPDGFVPREAARAPMRGEDAQSEALSAAQLDDAEFQGNGFVLMLALGTRFGIAPLRSVAALRRG